MTDAEIKAELEEQLSLINDKIRQVLTISEKYKVDTGSSKREFEDDLEKLMKAKKSIENQLTYYSDTNYATVFSPGW